jgi:glycosyltransferase involved in cell wall biosynthesis
MDLHGKLLSEGMAARGHHVTIISTRHPDGTEYEEKQGVKIYYLKKTVFSSRRKGWRRESVKKFFEFHRKQPFDVIWSQSFDAFGLTILSKTSLRIPIIPTLHGCIQQEASTFKTRLSSNFVKPQKILSSLGSLFFSYFIAQKPILSFSDKIITVSTQVTADIKKWYGKKMAEKCTTIYNGIDSNLFKPDPVQRMAIRQKHGIANEDILLLTLGRLTLEKGHHLAVEALKQLKSQDMNVKLLIVGDGEHLEILEEMIRKKGLKSHVFFTGQVDNTETIKYYNSADIFLMPTLTVEGLPFVLLEAMSCMKPVIASSIGGNVAVIEDGKNGLLVDPANVAQIADNIRLLVNDQNFAKKISESARKTILTKFNVDQMVERTLKLMESTVNKFSRSILKN